ncbi:MAG TPA: SDR family NAD(P)-dependent oxidoreductase [Solirubrobacteraceae bacterium]|nr:SDR family NAD(P)-dependent oxidoreductase [Solirubrobacteraceae bacterium]
MKLDGAPFIVTGAASGLGAATAAALASEGAKVLIADLDSARGEALASEIGSGARFHETDVTSERSAQDAIAAARSEFGGLRGLVNCAGVAVSERVLGRDGVHELATFMRVLEVNLAGTFNMTRLAAAAMAQGEPDEGGERGLVVCTASVAAFDGQIGQAAYSASKGGIAAMTLPLAREFARLGIRVVSIAPGIFDTPMLASLPAAARDSLGASVPFPARLGRPQEYAALVTHIATNPMLNGETIRLDGALRMAPR